MKKTKEELIKELALSEAKVVRLSGIDEDRRREFAKAFSWRGEPGVFNYGGRGEPILPSWEEIWIELGRLLAAKNFLDFEGNISTLEMKVNDILNREKPKSEL